MHGFGGIGRDLGAVKFAQYWHKMRQLGKAPSIEEYSIVHMAARGNKFMPPSNEYENSPLAEINYAYHFDKIDALFERGVACAHEGWLVNTDGRQRAAD